MAHFSPVKCATKWPLEPLINKAVVLMVLMARGKLTHTRETRLYISYLSVPEKKERELYIYVYVFCVPQVPSVPHPYFSRLPALFLWHSRIFEKYHKYHGYIFQGFQGFFVSI